MLHFSGHATEGQLLFEDEAGRAVAVDAEEMARSRLLKAYAIHRVKLEAAAAVEYGRVPFPERLVPQPNTRVPARPRPLLR